MVWKKNKRETIYELKNNDLHICIHKIVGLDGWYLSCNPLGISDKLLPAMTFDDAVLEAQKIVMEKAMELYKNATEFVKHRYDKNEFDAW